jgi:hypothetical protein
VAYTDLHEFLRMLAKHPKIRKSVRTGGPEAERLMKEAGLSNKEMALVRSQDVGAIKKYLGDKYMAAVSVHFED